VISEKGRLSAFDAVFAKKQNGIIRG